MLDGKSIVMTKRVGRDLDSSVERVENFDIDILTDGYIPHREP